MLTNDNCREPALTWHKLSLASYVACTADIASTEHESRSAPTSRADAECSVLEARNCVRPAVLSGANRMVDFGLFRLHKVSCSSWAITLLAISGACAAQQTDGALDEIIVTARYRAELIHQVPDTVQVFSARTLQDADVRDYADFVALSPNLSLVEAESVGQSFLTIRGLTEVRNGQAPVAFVVDGVQMMSNRQFTQNLFDLATIEILKGPQGALYGRNASGGAIVITTKPPTDQFEGHLDAGGGSGGESETRAVLSGPIVNDTLLFRVAGSFTDREGYFNNVYLNKTADPYEDVTGRALLRWTPSENVQVDLHLSYSHTNGAALNYHYQSALYDQTHPCFLNTANPFGGPTPNPNYVSYDYCSNNRGVDQRDLREAAIKLDWSVRGATLSAIFAYDTTREYLAGDQFPYTASRNVDGTDGTQTQFFNIKSASAELRLTSPSEQRLRWMFGGYYLDSTRFTSTTTGSDLGLGIVRLENAPAFDSPINPTLSWFADTDRDRVYAFFGNAAFDLTNQLEFSAAIRYDRDQVRQLVDPLNTSEVPAGCSFSAAGNCQRATTFDGWQPKLSIRYQLDHDQEIYGSWGRGFRSGAYNPYGTAKVAAAAGLQGVNDLLPSELTDSYEVGYRGAFDNRRYRLNAAFFDTIVRGQQYFVFLGQIGAQILVDIDRVNIRGGELELVVSPLSGLDLYASVGVSQSSIRKYAINPSDVGNWAPYVPQSTENVGAQYRFPISNRLRLMTRADFIVKGAQYWDPGNTGARSAVDLLNIRLGIEDAANRWTVTGGIKNVTNKAYNAEFVLGGFAWPAPPRTWTIVARYNFKVGARSH